MKKYTVKNKKIKNVISHLEKLQELINTFNEKHKIRKYNIKINKNTNDKYWVGEMNVDYEKASKIKIPGRVT